MILHKIFHMNQTIEETKQRLTEVDSYRHHLLGVEQADFTEHGISHWRLRLPMGFGARVVLTESVSEREDAAVFKSLDGNVELFGLVTFHAIRPNLTEVDVVVDYRFRSPLLRLLDRVFGLGDRFMVQQLRSVRAHFEGIAAPVPPVFDLVGTSWKAATT